MYIPNNREVNKMNKKIHIYIYTYTLDEGASLSYGSLI